MLGVPVALRDSAVQGGVDRNLGGADGAGISLAELPSRAVTFPCGAQVELRFLRLFSNLMFVCAKPQPPLAHVTDPQLLLRQLAVSALPAPSWAAFPGSQLGRVVGLSPEGWELLGPGGKGSPPLHTPL